MESQDILQERYLSYIEFLPATRQCRRKKRQQDVQIVCSIGFQPKVLLVCVVVVVVVVVVVAVACFHTHSIHV